MNLQSPISNLQSQNGARFRYGGSLGPVNVSGTLYVPYGARCIEFALRQLIRRTHQRTGVPICLMEKNSSILWKRA